MDRRDFLKAWLAALTALTATDNVLAQLETWDDATSIDGTFAAKLLQPNAPTLLANIPVGSELQSLIVSTGQEQELKDSSAVQFEIRYGNLLLWKAGVSSGSILEWVPAGRLRGPLDVWATASPSSAWAATRLFVLRGWL